MGKRRIRNLQKLGYTDISGFDVKRDRRKEVEKKFKINTFSNVEKAITEKPNLVIISTPPNLHWKYVKIISKKKIPFFTELNLISKDVKKIITILEKSKSKGFPSCTFYFHPIVLELKKILQKK